MTYYCSNLNTMPRDLGNEEEEDEKPTCMWVLNSRPSGPKSYALPLEPMPRLMVWPILCPSYIELNSKQKFTNFDK